uniref:F-box/kelch-repeat protein SKIP6 n=1 Tax=Anthurium amnicola TaxID=1678845 RepID=A0A1D1Y0C7_9ARAE
MGAAREFAAAGAVGGRIYVIGGCLPSSEPWAEALGPEEADAWVPVASPFGIREKWMHGNVVLDGKLLAVADHGGLLFDPADGSWGPVSTILDMGWKGRAAVVDGIIYSYDFLGKIKGFDPAADKWTEVEGVNEELPKFLSGATLADLSGRLCVLWEGKRVNGRSKEMEIMCAAIEVNKEEGGRLRGKIVWTEVIVLAVPKGSTVSHCLAVEI